MVAGLDQGSNPGVNCRWRRRRCCGPGPDRRVGDVGGEGVVCIRYLSRQCDIDGKPDDEDSEAATGYLLHPARFRGKASAPGAAAGVL